MKNRFSSKTEKLISDFEVVKLARLFKLISTVYLRFISLLASF